MVKSLQERIAAMMLKGAEISAQAATAHCPTIKSVSNIPEMLPACGDDVRAIPNIALRGALFGVIGKGPRKYEDKVQKTTINGITVYYTGPQLDQADLDVWAQCLNLNQSVPLGQKIVFSSNAFLARIGRNTGKTDRAWLHTALRRLMGAIVELGYDQYFYSGQLLHHWYRDEKTGKNSMLLNPELLPFFQAQQWTGLVINQRHALNGKPLAQWLHGFFSTHEKPFPYKVETIKGLCGSQRGELKKFRFDLKKSLSDLSIVTGWTCWVDENDLVNIKKK